MTKTIYAHRGLHSPGVPENSLAAAEDAIARGLGIECDIQRSNAGAAIVFHDWELDRLTDGKGLVGEKSTDFLLGLSLLGTDKTLVLLNDFLRFVAGRTPVLIEIKSKPDYDVDASCAEVAQALADYAGNHAVMSFDPRVPEWFASHSPQTCRGLVGTDSYLNGFEHMWRDASVIEQADPDFLAIDHRDLTKGEAASWRAAGKPLLSWTIRNGEDWVNAARLADALIAEGEALA
ncbi:MAG: glycerophosphodiester phosphodiesterase family protein [Pseudomonadota bacterium]